MLEEEESGQGTDNFCFFGRRKQLAIAWLSVPMSPPSRTSHRHPSVLASREKAAYTAVCTTWSCQGSEKGYALPVLLNPALADLLNPTLVDLFHQSDLSANRDRGGEAGAGQRGAVRLGAGEVQDGVR